MSFDADRAAWLAKGLRPDRVTHVVDVGANPAEVVPYQDMLKNGLCDVTGFEPQKEAFAKLQKTKGPNETYHNWAVGAGAERDLYITKVDTLTSIYRADTDSCQFIGYGLNRGMQVTQTERLAMRRLDGSDVRPFDLLKIDIQGGELEVFKGATQMLTEACAVIPEIRMARMYLDEPMFAGVDADLRARGFMFHKLLFVKSVQLPNSQQHRLNRRWNRSQALDGDAVYIRDLSIPDAVPSEQIKHLAILADSIWFSFDLVVRCLDILVDRGEIHGSLPEDYVSRLPMKVRVEDVQETV